MRTESALTESSYPSLPSVDEPPSRSTIAPAGAAASLADALDGYDASCNGFNGTGEFTFPLEGLRDGTHTFTVTVGD